MLQKLFFMNLLGVQGKQKNDGGQAEGRNRRVLRDIGNLVPVPAAKGKPQISRPVTRCRFLP